jgi:type I restriction-modification system DNA methylase subunit
MMWEKIAELTNQHGYMSGVDREPERVKKTGEIYTPTALVIEMMQKMIGTDNDIFAPGRTIIDPACGDGQLLVPVKWYKVLRYNITEEDALRDIYGVDIMRDNVDLCKRRLGGGNIYMGNTLSPEIQLDEQTEEEHEAMKELFSDISTLDKFFV